jgi:2-polyprenyl-6-methoxyphenol hydroxylase-like FAD-dependent oxidoreductase
MLGHMDVENANRVLIAGGGIAGLAMTRALHQKGVLPLMLERRGEPADAGLAINLPGNAVRALAHLGLADALREVGSPVRRREYRTERGRLLFEVDEDAFWGADASPRCLRRADLLRLLKPSVSPDSIRQGCGVAAVRQHRQGVAIELTDGTLETGGLLVGADGVHSTVRNSVFGYQALGAALLAPASWRFMTPNPGIECWTLWAGAGGLFLLIPVDRGEAYGWVSASGGQSRSRDLSAFRTVFASFPAWSATRLMRSWLSRARSTTHPSRKFAFQPGTMGAFCS